MGQGAAGSAAAAAAAVVRGSAQVHFDPALSYSSPPPGRTPGSWSQGSLAWGLRWSWPDERPHQPTGQGRRCPLLISASRSGRGFAPRPSAPPSPFPTLSLPPALKTGIVVVRAAQCGLSLGTTASQATSLCPGLYKRPLFSKSPKLPASHFTLAGALADSQCHPAASGDVRVCREAPFLLDFLVRPRRRRTENTSCAKPTSLCVGQMQPTGRRVTQP